MTSNAGSDDSTRGRVRSAIEEELALIHTLEDAEAVLCRVDQLTVQQTEDTAGERAAGEAASAPAQVERVSDEAPKTPARAADVLVESAAQAVAPTPEAPAVAQGAQDATGGNRDAPPSHPAARRGRSLLRQAVLRRMGPLQALDARIYLEINGVAHPAWLDDACKLLTIVTTGGWIWIAGTLVAYRMGVPRGRAALCAVVPCVIGSTWMAEYPVKAYFRRRRPFIDVVRALVVGKEPGSWSFPSGHTCAAFAAAWVLGVYWTGMRPLFFAVAAAVGYSRVFVGAHYPGDVAAGGILGILFAEAIRRASHEVSGRFGES